MMGLMTYPGLVQAPEGGKQSIANILASYVGFPFVDPSCLTLALQAFAALIKACATQHAGNLSLARCMLNTSTGTELSPKRL